VIFVGVNMLENKFTNCNHSYWGDFEKTILKELDKIDLMEEYACIKEHYKEAQNIKKTRQELERTYIEGALKWCGFSDVKNLVYNSLGYYNVMKKNG